MAAMRIGRAPCLFLIAAVGARAFGGCGAAWASDATPPQSPAVQLTFTYYGDLFGNPSGGVKQGPGYDGRFGAIVDADLGRLVGWPGAKFHASFHQIHGSELSANNL